MAKLTKTQQEIISAFGFEVSVPPERSHEGSRRSKYDDMWDKATELLTSMPGVSVKIRTYRNASAAYAEAKSINNSEHRHFKDGTLWTAVAAKDTEVTDEGEPIYALWLTYNGE